MAVYSRYRLSQSRFTGHKGSLSEQELKKFKSKFNKAILLNQMSDKTKEYFD